MIPVLQHWGIRKQKRFKRKDYLAFIASLKCLICGSVPECSHTIPKSAGNNASDALVLPLCPQCHRIGRNSIHNLGLEGFQRVHKIDLNEAVYAMWTMFFHKQGMSLDQLISGLTTREQILSTVEFNITRVTKC